MRTSFEEWISVCEIKWKSDMEKYYAHAMFTRNIPVINFFTDECKIPLSLNVCYAFAAGETDDVLLFQKYQDEMFKLLSSGDYDGMFCHSLIYSGSIKVYTHMLETEKIELRRSKGLLFAIDRDQLDIIKVIAKHFPRKFKDYTQVCLERAIEKGKLECVKWLVEEEDPSLIEEKEKRDQIKVKAVEYGHMEIFEYISTSIPSRSGGEEQEKQLIVHTIKTLEELLKNLKEHSSCHHQRV